jgi:hypothetical protein
MVSSFAGTLPWLHFGLFEAIDVPTEGAPS